MSGGIKKQTISGVKWTAIESVSSYTITFVLGIILARLLNPTDYGTIGVLSVFIAISGTFIDSGFGQAIIRKKDLTDLDCSTVFYFNIGVSIFCYMVLFIGSPRIAEFFRMPILSSIIKVYCFTLVIGAFESVQINRLLINLDFKSLAKINVLSTIVSGVIGLSFAYLGFGVWALVFQAVLSRIFHLVLVWLMAKWHPLLVFSKESFKELFGFGGKLLASGILWQIYANLTPIIIGKFFSARDLGNYTRGSQLAIFPSNVILGILDRVIYPILAKIQDDKERLVSIYRKYIRCTSLAIMFPLILLGALGKPIVLILLTDKWISCVIFLQIYIFSAMFDHIDKLNINLLKVVGKSGLILKMEIYKRAISISMILLAIPFGVIGICVSKVIYEQIALIFNTYYSGKLFGMGYFSQMKDYMPYALYSLIACLPSFFLTFTALPYWAMIAFGVPVSIAIYIIIVHIKKDDAYIEFALPQIKRALRKL